MSELNDGYHEDGTLYQRDVDDNHFVAVYRMLYNDRVVFGPKNSIFHDRGFCFPQDGSAFVAAETWDGTGDPEGPWIKEVGTERYGPGMAAIR